MQLIHIGYPKCASTSLQNSLFKQPQYGFNIPLGAQCIQLLHELRVLDTFEFDNQIDMLRTRYAPTNGDNVDVYSHEHLLVDPYGELSQVREGVRRIKKIFDSPKILLIIREQRSAIISSYNEHLRRGYSTTFSDFININEKEVGYRSSVARLDEFKYNNLIEYLYKKFEQENVLVLPLETLRQPIFFDRLYSFLKRPKPKDLPNLENIKDRSSRKGDLVFLRKFNILTRPGPPNRGSIFRRALYGVNIALSPLVPDKLYQNKRTSLYDHYNLTLSQFYYESNRNTSKLIGINLAKYGYV